MGSPWGHKELDITERLSLSFFLYTNVGCVGFGKVRLGLNE